MKKLLLILTLSTITFTLFAQVSAIEWSKCLGGFYPDFGYSIQQTTDGGYIVAGETYSNDGDVSGNHGNMTSDFWVVKLNSFGNIQWQKALGGTINERAFDIKQTNDGGYVVAGFCFSNNGDVTGNHGLSDYWVVKLNSSGNIQWQKALGGSLTDWAFSIQQTSDNGYIVAGESNSIDGDVTENHGSMDFWIVKLDSSGILKWQKSLGGSHADIAYSILQINDGGYIVTGYTESNDGNVSGNHGAADFWIVKLDSIGILQWQKALGGKYFEVAKSIKQTSDGGFIIAGMSESNDGDVTINNGRMDQWVVKINSSGTIEWQNSFGGSNYDYAHSVQQINDGGYIVAGYTESNDSNVTGNHGERDYWVIKLNSSGILEWQKTYGGTNDDDALSIQQTSDGGFIVAGNTCSYNGDVSANHGSYDYWVVKLSSTSLVNTLICPANKIIVYPNPVSSSITIETGQTDKVYIISIYDINGKEMLKKAIINSKTTIDVSNYQSGLYFIKTKTGNKVEVVKFVKN